MLNSGICIVEKSGNCGCVECEEKLKQKPCSIRRQAIPSNKMSYQYDNCKGSCDSSAIAAGVWCSKTFKNALCQTACCLAVYAMQQTCYWCCSEGDFYKKCIQPLESVLSVIGQGSDPIWD